MKTTLILISVTLSAFVAVAALPTAEDARAGGDRFAVDAVHSSLIFKIRYAGLTDFYGRFGEYSGTFVVDESKLENSHFDITVKAASIDSANKKRDEHLRSPDFFSAKRHPEIRFVSKKVKNAGDRRLAVTGELTLRGVTKEVTADVAYGGQKPDRGGVRAGFDGSLTIRRDDFGITFGAGMLGSDVTIIMGLTGVKK